MYSLKTDTWIFIIVLSEFLNQNIEKKWFNTKYIFYDNKFMQIECI